MNLITAIGRALMSTIVILCAVLLIFMVFFVLVASIHIILSHFTSDMELQGVIFAITFLSIVIFGIALKAELDYNSRKKEGKVDENS